MKIVGRTPAGDEGRFDIVAVERDDGSLTVGMQVLGLRFELEADEAESLGASFLAVAHAVKTGDLSYAGPDSVDAHEPIPAEVIERRRYRPPTGGVS